MWNAGKGYNHRNSIKDITILFIRYIYDSWTYSKLFTKIGSFGNKIILELDE